jgi:hypothetical protein
MANYKELADCYATLRDFMKKFDQKKFKKKIQKIFREILFSNFFGYHGSTFNLEYACENLGGLGQLVWEKIENVQTVHKGLAKLLYRLSCPLPDSHELLSKFSISVLARVPALKPPVTMTVSVWPC